MMALENVVTFPSAEESGLDHLGITIDRNRDKDLSEQAYNSRTIIVINTKIHHNRHLLVPQLHIVLEI